MSLSDTSRSSVTYHHGALHRALLDSAMAIVAETGRWDFSLREVARHAGVSKNAPYRHFADKQALLEEMAVAGFAGLRDAGAAALERAVTPPDKLFALGRAHIGWGMANPALYRLMFGQTLSGKGAAPALLDGIDRSRQALRAVLQYGAARNDFQVDVRDEAGLTTAATSAWSLIHGVTLLQIDDVLQREGGGNDVTDLPERIIRFFVAQLRTRA